MDINEKKQCATQLQGLATTLPGLDDEAVIDVILDVCVALMKVVDQKPSLDNLDKSVFDERMDNHKAIYQSMKKFMEGAAQMVPLEEATQALLDAEKLYDDAERERQNTLREVEAKKASIEELKKQGGELFERFVAASEEKARLDEFNKNFNPLTAEKFTQQVDQLQEATKELEERHHTLNRETVECLEQLSKNLEAIGKYAKEHNDKIEQVRDQADQYLVAVRSYCKAYPEYKEWLDAVKTPYKKFKDMAGDEEAELLRKVMSTEDLKLHDSRVEQIEKNLTELEGFIHKCTTAANTTYEKIAEESKV